MLLAQSYISGYSVAEGEREQRKGRGRRGRKQTDMGKSRRISRPCKWTKKCFN